MSNIDLPQYVPQRGLAVARRLVEQRAQSRAAAKELQNQLDRLDDVAAKVFAEEDERAATQRRLADLAKTTRATRN